VRPDRIGRRDGVLIGRTGPCTSNACQVLK
jgi:hypothetical protein